MSRSVSTLSHSHTVCYYDVSWMGMEKRAICEECDEHHYHPCNEEPDQTICCDTQLVYEDVFNEDNCDWDWFMESITEQFQTKYTSLDNCDRWEDEDHIFLENELIEVAVSEYCGLASISIRAKDEFYSCEAGKANFANRMADYVGKWMEANIGDLRSVGRFSNGEHVLERITDGS